MSVATYTSPTLTYLQQIGAKWRYLVETPKIAVFELSNSLQTPFGLSVVVRYIQTGVEEDEVVVRPRICDFSLFLGENKLIKGLYLHVIWAQNDTFWAISAARGPIWTIIRGQKGKPMCLR